MSETKIEYHAITTIYSCGHEKSHGCSVFREPITILALCDDCETKRDEKANRIMRRLTGATPDHFPAYTLRWRLRATEEEVRAALAAIGVTGPRLMRDSGDNPEHAKIRYRDALQAMKSGIHRCACGSTGSWSRTISGTIAGEAAMWAKCDRCPGTAIGGGLTGSELHDARAAIEAAKRCEEDIDVWVAEA